MTTFVALGDSFTQGVGDPVRRDGGRGGRSWAWRGWAALLAEGLREPRLHNLASSGAQTTDVERDQLPGIRFQIEKLKRIFLALILRQQFE